MRSRAALFWSSLGLTLLLILPRFWQLDGAWLSYPLADVCANACTAYLVIRQFKKFKAVEKK